jgi:hypothetical protein
VAGEAAAGAGGAAFGAGGNATAQAGLIVVVDGGHSFVTCLSDLRLAQRLGASAIVVDDVTTEREVRNALEVFLDCAPSNASYGNVQSKSSGSSYYQPLRRWEGLGCGVLLLGKANVEG